MNAVMQKLRDLVSRKFPRKQDAFRHKTVALYEITVPCLAGIYRASWSKGPMARMRLKPGMWTFWRYRPRMSTEAVFASREEAELSLAVEGYGIGRKLGKGNHSVEWELVEL